MTKFNKAYVDREVRSRTELTVIVPMHVRSARAIAGLAGCYASLMADVRNLSDFRLEVLVVDSSPGAVTTSIEEALSTVDGIAWHRVSWPLDHGVNGKLLNVDHALSLASFDCIAILDDDARPTVDCLLAAAKLLQTSDSVRLAPTYANPHIMDAIDMAGVLVVNTLAPDKQFWANFCFRKSSLPGGRIQRMDVLFDELSIYRSTRHLVSGQRSVVNRYLYESLLPMESSRSGRTFLAQRSRYAYENLAYPVRFIANLAVLPTMALLMLMGMWMTLAITLVCFATAVVVAAAVDYRKWPKGALPWYVVLLAPMWAAPYPFFSWVALGLYFRGGVTFGESRIRRPA